MEYHHSAKKISLVLVLSIMVQMAAFNRVDAAQPTLLGLDVLVKDDFEVLKGRRVALITNQTGLDRNMRSTVDLLHSSRQVKLICILAPEHGFRGVALDGEHIADSVDPKTGVPIYGLYGQSTRPTEEMLKDVDTIVFDIQDIGTRFYTYISTMGQALEEAAKRKLRFIVLDRPNPIRGDIVEGDILDSDIRRMTGYFPIPVRHGLTVGELAAWLNGVQQLNARLTVVSLKNWSRDRWFEDTGLPFTPPSPNIRRLTSALLYPGIGCFEATNVSVGRGTDRPFEIFGAPWINARALCAYLRSQNFPGVLFEVEEFTPTSNLYQGQVCKGVRLIVTHRAQIRPFDVFVRAFEFLYKENPKDFNPNWEEVRVVTGSRRLQETMQGKLTVEEYFSELKVRQNEFVRSVFPYLLY